LHRIDAARHHAQSALQNGYCGAAFQALDWLCNATNTVFVASFVSSTARRVDSAQGASLGPFSWPGALTALTYDAAQQGWRRTETQTMAGSPRVRRKAGGEYLQKILTARVYDVAIESPLEVARTLSRRLGNQVLLKREDQQPVFSFKLRGAYNKMVHLSRVSRCRPESSAARPRS
jgi:hypothetical protein